jgi:hypothetical protein
MKRRFVAVGVTIWSLRLSIFMHIQGDDRMNQIQQISLKLQMGIDPSVNIEPLLLRQMWRELKTENTAGLRGSAPHSSQTRPRRGRLSKFT